MKNYMLISSLLLLAQAGRFFGTFVEDSMFLNSGHSVPDTVRIEDATFECKIKLE